MIDIELIRCVKFCFLFSWIIAFKSLRWELHSVKMRIEIIYFASLVLSTFGIFFLKFVLQILIPIENWNTYDASIAMCDFSILSHSCYFCCSDRKWRTVPQNRGHLSVRPPVLSRGIRVWALFRGLQSAMLSIFR